MRRRRPLSAESELEAFGAAGGKAGGGVAELTGESEGGGSGAGVGAGAGGRAEARGWKAFDDDDSDAGSQGVVKPSSPRAQRSVAGAESIAGISSGSRRGISTGAGASGSASASTGTSKTHGGGC